MTSRICSFAGCGLPHSAKGFCSAHYMQNKRGVELTPINSTIRGVQRHGTYSNYANYGCRCELCKIAVNNYNAGRLSVQKSNGKKVGESSTAQRARAMARKEMLNYDEELAKRNGRCEICGKEKPLVWDHCHETGTFRGFICSGCNTGLGHLGDTVEALTRALNYLKSS